MPTVKLHTEVPGPKSLELVARREAATAKGTAKLTRIAAAKAEGAAVTDVDGNVLLDFAGGIGMMAVGHNQPSIVDAIKRQADDLIHMSAIVGSYESYATVAEMLNDLAPGDFPKKAALLNSGAEAVEAAVKMARVYTGKQGVIVFEGAYHGRTNLTMAMTSKWALFKKGFGPFAPEIYRLPFPNVYRRPEGLSEEAFVDYSIQQLEQALISFVDPGAVAAIVIEPVLGEGGFIPTPPRFLQRIRELCSEHNMVMVADEIQCGMGRTGKVFAIEHYGIVPDLLTTAKSLAAGMPLAAVVGRVEIIDAPHPGGLGGTYSGNPLACVAAIEALKIISSEAFLSRAQELGERLRGHLLALKQDFEVIGDVRGLGPMLALELVSNQHTKTPDAALTSKLNETTLKHGLITIRAGLFSNCVRFLPPLTMTNEQLEEGIGVLRKAFEIVSQDVAVATD
ncbi:MAG: 4-aminobutyrate--2-oxoglutarate transaminase [Deinococcota bacterium]